MIKSICNILGIVVLILVVHTSAFAQSENAGQIRLTKEAIMKMTPAGTGAPGSSNLSAVQEIIIFGDPSKPGLYTIILKVAANTKIPAHLHPDQRMATVISGTWHFGYGNKWNSDSLVSLPPGSIYSEVAGQNHFAMTNEAVVVEITGYGPSGVVYSNPLDDPKKKK